jgi:Na+/proline symporter
MSDDAETALGVLLALITGVVVAALSLAALLTGSLMSPVLVACVGLTQLLIVVPACLIANRKGRAGLMRGLIIGAAIVFLLNAACDGVMFGGMWGKS